MNGRRIYHARGKVLGGSSSINGMIFQRGNPLDYERWAADPGMETWDYAHCLPYFKRMENCLAAARTTRSAGTRAAGARARPGDQPAVRGVLRGGAAGRLPADRRRERLPAGGLRRRSTGTSTAAAGCRAARAYLHPVMGRPNLTVETPGLRHQDPVRGHPRGRRRVTCTAGKAEQVSGRRGRSCAAARSTRRSCSSCPASATPPSSRALGIDVVADLPGVGENLQDHLEVYIQYGCKQPVSVAARAEVAQPARGRRCSGCSAGPGPAATNHFEGGGFARSNDDVAYPNLMFHFLPHRDPLRRLAARGRPRLPGPHRPDVLRRARHGEDHLAPTRRCTRRCGSTTCRPTRTGGSGSRRSASPGRSSTQPAFDAFNGGELSPGPVGRDRRGDPGLGGQGRRDRAAPVVHVPDGHRRDGGGRPGDDAGARAGGPAGGRRLGHALRHERQHLRAGDDDWPRRRPT